MISKIFIIFFLVISVFAAAALFMPIVTAVKWYADEKAQRGILEFFWGTPFLFFLVYDLNRKSLKVKLFSRFVFTGSGSEPVESETRKSTGREDKTRETAGPENYDSPIGKEEDESLDEEKDVREDVDEETGFGRARREDAFSHRQEQNGEMKGNDDSGNGQGAQAHGGDEKKIKNSGKGLIDRIKNSFPFFLLKQKRYLKRYLLWTAKALGRMFRLVSLECLVVRVKASTGEPAVNGMLTGLSSAVRQVFEMETGRGVCLDFQTDFQEEEYYSTEGYLRIKSSLSRFGYVFLMAGITFPFYSFLITYLNYRKFRKIKNSGGSPAQS